jgi:hypothetical protein
MTDDTPTDKAKPPADRDETDLGIASTKILRDRLTPQGGFQNKWQRQRARRRAKHTGGHDANYK